MIYNVAVTHPAGGKDNAIHLLGNSTLKNVLDFIETIRPRVDSSTYTDLCKFATDFYEKEGEGYFKKGRNNFQKTIIVNNVRIALIQV